LGKEGAFALKLLHAADHAAKTIQNRSQASEATRRDLEELIAVVELLAETGALPSGYRPHKLSGEWKGVWECHVEPDWLLIYQITPAEVVVIRTGTHTDLFE
jgi:mRNA interferase YafQ